MLDQEDEDIEEENWEFSIDKHLQYISEYLGPFTKEYLDGCPEFVRKQYFDDDGMFTHSSKRELVIDFDLLVLVR